MFGSRRTLATTGARATIVAAIMVAALAVLGVGASTASAACTTTEGKGMKTVAEGSSLQNSAQTFWTGAWNTECAGTGPEFEYISTSSGKGMNKWNADGVSGKIDTTRYYIGTDDAPTGTGKPVNQIANIEKASGTKLIVIPVTQAAIAIAVNPPKECTITKIRKGQLEQAFRGTILKWRELATVSDTSVGGKCDSAITRVVRADSSGTTYQLKHYLFLNNGANLPCLTTTTWEKLQEPSKNQTWPETCGTTLSTLLKSKAGGTGEAGTGSGGGDEVKTVNETAGSIGYAVLADVENNKKGSTHQLEVQNGPLTSEFASPLTATEKMSNCEKAVYKIPLGGRSGEANENIDWSGVYGSGLNTTGYSICTLTWDLAFKKYETAGFATEKTGPVIKKWFEHILATQAGLTGAENYYSKLPSATGSTETDVQAAAETAATKIG